VDTCVSSISVRSRGLVHQIVKQGVKHKYLWIKFILHCEINHSQIQIAVDLLCVWKFSVYSTATRMIWKMRKLRFSNFVSNLVVEQPNNNVKCSIWSRMNLPRTESVSGDAEHSYRRCWRHHKETLSMTSTVKDDWVWAPLNHCSHCWPSLWVGHLGQLLLRRIISSVTHNHVVLSAIAAGRIENLPHQTFGPLPNATKIQLPIYTIV